MLEAKEVFKVWRPSGNLRIDLPLMKGIVKRYKEEKKNFYDDELNRIERAMYDARRN